MQYPTYKTVAANIRKIMKEHKASRATLSREYVCQLSGRDTITDALVEGIDAALEEEYGFKLWRLKKNKNLFLVVSTKERILGKDPMFLPEEEES